MLRVRDDIRAARELFVRGHSGTTEGEMAAIGLVVALAFATHYAAEAAIAARKIKMTRVQSLALEFVLLVGPVLAMLTAAADSLTVLVTALVSLLVTCRLTTPRHKRLSGASSTVAVSLSRSVFGLYRSSLLLTTAVAILAVDFPIFPRRFAKTETFGLSPMDAGVGGFILANALVSWPARRAAGVVNTRARSVLHSALSSLAPLVALGLMRLMAIKAANYQEHESEYGTHWNFFFTLATVTLLALATDRLVPAQYSGALAAVLAVGHQWALSYGGLDDYILRAPRTGFVSANREGLASVSGFLALYLAGIEFGAALLAPRSVAGWQRASLATTAGAVVALIGQLACSALVSAPSRRLMNFGYLLLTVWFSLAMIAAFTAVALWSHAGSHHWQPQLVALLNRRPLAFFLACNALTGLVNLIVDTHDQSDTMAFVVLVCYLLVALAATHCWDMLRRRGQSTDMEVGAGTVGVSCSAGTAGL